MANQSAARFEFIGHALAGDGPFRPVVTTDGNGRAINVGTSYLVKYPRESQEKFARRCELAFYSSPLSQACSRFVGYLSTRPAVRELPHDLYASMAADIDGKGNSIGVFWQQFMTQFKARGSMLLLVDMPATMAPSMAAQMETRTAPYWTAIKPEDVTDYSLGDDGRFDFVAFAGNYTDQDGARIPCTWRFDRLGWQATDQEKNILDAGEHPLSECPVLIGTEGGDFPHFGPFAPIADLSKRLFNLDSELDEILRSQTFSLLTMNVPQGSTSDQKLDAARVAGQTIGTNNLMVYEGTAPGFIAPDSGPATTYITRIDKLRDQIAEIGLSVATVNQQESGIAMQMRFASINAELSSFAERMEDLERRAWELSRQWLQMTQAPSVEWPRDFNVADVEKELKILADMQASAMPVEVIAAQQKRIVSIQFAGAEQEDAAKITQAIDDRVREVQ
jgi:hypothetical protein